MSNNIYCDTPLCISQHIMRILWTFAQLTHACHAAMALQLRSLVAAYLFLVSTTIVRLIQQAAATQLEMCIQADTWTVLCAVLST